MHAIGQDGLTEADRKLFLLLREGYTLKEAAIALGMSPQSAKSHVQRAGHRLLIPGGHGLAQRVLARIDGEVLDDEKLRKLKPVQRDIVKLAIKGRTLNEIARDLGLGSVQTVKGRLKDIYDRTGASTIGELRSLLVIPTSSKEAVLQ